MNPETIGQAAYLLDTNYVSELVRLQPDPKAISWIDSVDPATIYLSVITLAEIRKGVNELAEGARRTNLDRWLTVELPSRFSGQLLSVDAAIAEYWGTLAAWGKRKGTPLPWADGFLAATAMQKGLTLVTRNTKDFIPFGVQVLNPWVD